MAHFDRKVVRSGNRFQIWLKVAGGNWSLFIDRDDYHDQYGPYAR